MTKRTPTQKKDLLAQLIENYVFEGVYIGDVICKPLSYFDFDLVEQKNKEYSDKKF